ncbi:type I 3-dehydroquinate dehydratase [Ramlibacter sp. PS4R-6]|uniref:type I 3-dehydroquinate dehydratase n=1 Tax=Ramlibacter sp. PS4R-6 TaxID=3133438 RepID=UPI0030AAF65C
MAARPIVTRHGELAFPAVCAPLVARTASDLQEECAAVAAKKPDLLEWRVDFFSAIGDMRAVLAAARDLRAAANGIPILFTRRSVREGGERIPVSEEYIVDLYGEVCAGGLADLVDVEMESEASHLRTVQMAAKDAGAMTVLSFHNFRATPSVQDLVARFERAYTLGADVAKVAVMPQSPADVLGLMAATQQAAHELPIPVVSMAMGPLGAVTRTAGWVFGSAMTFAVGRSSSAPGQMPIEDVRFVVEALKRAQSPKA